MEERSDTALIGAVLDSITSKLGMIWVWSVLCAAAGLIYHSSGAVVMMSGVGIRFGTGSMLDAQQVVSFIVALLVLISVLASMCYLYLFLSHCLLPTLFSGVSPKDAGAGSRDLRRAFAALVCGIAAEVGGCVVGVVLRLAFRSL